ncbi:MAG: aspartate ammonia-lyase, partial [Lachnospiraceae bacterium]|nr:aspartate ammonia-lyase [Lachnospiraceae bacterium]
ITANEDRCRELVENSVGIVTVLAPVIGYQRAADIAKKALYQNRPVREIILEEKVLEPAEIDRVLDVVNMTEPGSL